MQPDNKQHHVGGLTTSVTVLDLSMAITAIVARIGYVLHESAF
jgi:hypothetical protein